MSSFDSSEGPRVRSKISRVAASAAAASPAAIAAAPLAPKAAMRMTTACGSVSGPASDAAVSAASR